MANPKARSRFSASTALAAAFVLGAGAMAWYGTRPDAASPTGPDASAEATTIAGEPRQAASETLAAAESGQPSVVPGNLPTRIVVSSAGIDSTIAEVGVVRQDGRTVWETAWRSAGHHLDSARPGQPGNMVITGHVSVVDRANVAVFKTLDRVKPGDIVEVSAGDSVYRYAVDRVTVVSPAALNLLRSSHDARVTLITCTQDLKLRLVVSGRLV